MIRNALIAAAAIAASVAATEVAAQGGAPVRTLAAAEGQWAVVRIGEAKISHCMMGVRSDAAAPAAGKPQFMITADDQFAILRVRAAEWSFSGGRDIAVRLVTSGGQESQPAAVVLGRDMIDIAIGAVPGRMAELAASTHIDIRAEGTTVRLPLSGIARVLPAYQDCVSSVGQPVKPQVHAAALR